MSKKKSGIVLLGFEARQDRREVYSTERTVYQGPEPFRVRLDVHVPAEEIDAFLWAVESFMGGVRERAERAGVIHRAPELPPATKTLPEAALEAEFVDE